MAQGIVANPPQTQNDQQIVQGLAQAELTGRIKNAAETYNLAQDLDENTLSQIGKEVWRGFDEDCHSRAEWLEMHAFWLSLYMQQDYAENGDPDRSWGATESVPILMESCNQFQARTYKIFFPSDTFVSAIPIRKSVQDRKQLEDRAQRIGDHMSYQLGYQDRNYKPDKDALFLGVALHGSFFTKTYFDAGLKRFKVANVRPTDLVVNYSVGPERIEELRRKTHIIYGTVGESETLVKNGYFIEAAKPCTLEINKQYNTVVNETQGLTESSSFDRRNRSATYLEQHCYLDLDDSGDFHPYIVTICAASQRVLRLSIGYEADQMGNPLHNYQQVQYFTHYKFQENPDGFYGLGLGHSIGDLNSAVNIMLRQSMDASTLANDGNMSGFVSDKLGLEGDEIRMVLGKYIKVPDTISDFKNSIMTMEFPGPNAALMQLMEMLDQRAQRLGSTTEATTGTPDAVIQPTTYLSQIEQALEQFSSVQMRLSYALTDELQKIYKINQKYLPLVDSFVVNGEPEMVARADYTDDMLVMPIFDPKYATQSQKVARAQAELQATMQNPVNQSRPQVYDEAFRRYFEALNIDDIDALLPPQPQVENFDNQYEENMFFLMPQASRPPFDVFPDQNHQQHLDELQQFVQQYGQQLQPEQQQTVINHKMKHEAYLYGQQHGVIPPGQEPTPPLAARQGDTMGNGPAAPSIPGMALARAAQILGTSAPVSGPAPGSAYHQ